MDGVGDVLQREPLGPLLSLQEHAGASVGGKVELLHHHVFGNADLLPQVQTLWHHETESTDMLLISSLTSQPRALSEQRHLFAVGYETM